MLQRGVFLLGEKRMTTIALESEQAEKHVARADLSIDSVENLAQADLGASSSAFLFLGSPSSDSFPENPKKNHKRMGEPEI